MTSRLLPLGALIVTALFSFPQDAAAQGRGRPKAPKAPKASTAAASSTGPSTAASVDTAAAGALSPVASFRQFGSWLDDASPAAPHGGHFGIGAGYWRMSGGSQLNVPMLDVGYGFTDRIQASASVPFYRSNYAGTAASGLDDIYMAGKVTLIDPTLTVSEFGLAVGSVVELLSPGSPDGRLHYAVPVSLELRRQPWRAFGSAGYFSRGSVFAGGALEWSGAAGYVVTAAVTQSYSTGADATLDALGVNRKRADVTGSVAYPIGRSAATYVSVGRSLTGAAEGATSLSLAGGLSFRFSAGNAIP